VLKVIQQMPFPVLLAREDSYEVASKVHDVNIKTRPDDHEKIAASARGEGPSGFSLESELDNIRHGQSIRAPPHRSGGPVIHRQIPQKRWKGSGMIGPYCSGRAVTEGAGAGGASLLEGAEDFLDIDVGGDNVAESTQSFMSSGRVLIFTS